MKKGFKKGILISAGIVTLATTGIILGAGGDMELTKDVTAPHGSISIQGATEVNNINYVDRTSIVVSIQAQDDTCSASEIKYYLSTSPISTEEVLNESLWKTYSEGVTETIELSDTSPKNKIYAVFKDKYGNTSAIYNGDATKYTVTFDANGGENAPGAQSVYYGMSLNLSMERPIKTGKYFARLEYDKRN